MATLFDTDIARWADEQSAALRRLAESGASNAVDWENVIEEVESVGRSQRQAVDSLLVNALTHLLKICGDPDALSLGKWSSEVKTYLDQVRPKVRGAILTDLDLDELWRDSVESAEGELRLYGRVLPPDVPARCPFSLAELLARPADVAGLLRKLPDHPGRS